jgi:hypothetical protein
LWIVQFQGWKTAQQYRRSVLESAPLLIFSCVKEPKVMGAILDAVEYVTG